MPQLIVTTLFRLLGRLAPLLLLVSFSAAHGFGKIPVLLSTDVGNEIDDQWAITYMLLNPAFAVQGIISAHAPNLPAPSAHASYEVLVDVVEHRLRMTNHPPLREGASVALSDAHTPLRNGGVDLLLKCSRRFSKRHRLNVLTIGAATDVASAILIDPSLADRINVVAMGFRNLSEAGKEFNVQNDPHAWQAIFASKVPVAIGSGDVCKSYLSLNYGEAKQLVSTHGAIGAWLWQDYKAWYFKNVEPEATHDLSKSWVIWDIVVLAYEEGWTTQKSIPRPQMDDDLRFAQQDAREEAKRGVIQWITTVDSARLWSDFVAKLDRYQRGNRSLN